MIWTGILKTWTSKIFSIQSFRCFNMHIWNSRLKGSPPFSTTEVERGGDAEEIASLPFTWKVLAATLWLHQIIHKHRLASALLHSWWDNYETPLQPLKLAFVLIKFRNSLLYNIKCTSSVSSFKQYACNFTFAIISITFNKQSFDSVLISDRFAFCYSCYCFMFCICIIFSPNILITYTLNIFTLYCN